MAPFYADKIPRHAPSLTYPLLTRCSHSTDPVLACVTNIQAYMSYLYMYYYTYSHRPISHIHQNKLNSYRILSSNEACSRIILKIRTYFEVGLRITFCSLPLGLWITFFSFVKRKRNVDCFFFVSRSFPFFWLGLRIPSLRIFCVLKYVGKENKRSVYRCVKLQRRKRSFRREIITM